MPEPGRADGAGGTAGAFSGRTGDVGDADDVAQGGPGSPGGKDAQGSQDGGVVAVLTAAGSGTRLGASGPKALVEIAGESLVRRAARGLLSAGVVRHVVVTAPAEYLDRFEAEVAGVAGVAGIAEVAGLDGPGVSGTIEVVPGSPDSRQASVALGLAAAVMTGSVIIEKIFDIPGIGRFFVNGALNRDYTLVLGVVVFYGALILLFNLLVDLAYAFLDPKVRLRS